MLIENESQWNTDDLKALVAKVIEHEKLDPASPHIEMLIFRTSTPPRYYYDRKAQTAEVAWSGVSSVKIVKILGKSKLIESNTLDRLAAVTQSNVVQDISPKLIKDIALSIGDALTGRYSHKGRSYKWAETCQFRLAPQSNKKAARARTKVEILKRKLVDINAAWKREVNKTEKLIRTLQAELT